MLNKDGKTVAPTSAAFQAAAANADWNSVPGYGVILANQAGRRVVADDGRDLHPHSKKPDDAAAVAEALKFFAWAYAKGDKMAEELDYVPMPKKVVDRYRKGLGQRDQGRNGKPLFTEGAMAH